MADRPGLQGEQVEYVQMAQTLEGLVSPLEGVEGVYDLGRLSDGRLIFLPFSFSQQGAQGSEAAGGVAVGG